MNSTPVIDMFSGTGQLAVAVTRAIHESTSLVSFSDNYAPARKYLRHRFPETQVASDFRDQIVPEGSIVTIGAPCQDLSVAGKRAGAERGSGTRSSLIHEALDMAVAGGADLIVAENVPGGHSTYLALAAELRNEHDYAAIVTTGGAWEVGAPHRRERIMLVAACRPFIMHGVPVLREIAPRHMAPTPTASSSTGPGRAGRSGGANLQTWIHEGHYLGSSAVDLWSQITGRMDPPCRDDEGRLSADFVEWLMDLPFAGATGLSRTARIRLAGNAVVAPQAQLMLERAQFAYSNPKEVF